MRTCRSSTGCPGVRPSSSKHTPGLIPLAALALAGAVSGCRDDVESPAGPEPTPELATSSTIALAFKQVSAGASHTCGVTTDNLVRLQVAQGAEAAHEYVMLRQLLKPAVEGRRHAG